MILGDLDYGPQKNEVWTFSYHIKPHLRIEGNTQEHEFKGRSQRSMHYQHPSLNLMRLHFISPRSGDLTNSCSLAVELISAPQQWSANPLY